MSEHLQGFAPKPRHGVFTSLRSAARTALLLPLLLLGCSGVALPREDAPASGPDPAYSKMIAKRLQTFKDYDTYDTFEISEFRWVHSVKGWAWLACVRFQDHGHRRTYALFIKGDEIIQDRFAVESDGCGTLAYSPFDLMPSTAKPASTHGLEPLH